MTQSPATHCVVCGADAMLAPRIHVRDVRTGETPRDIALGLCEAHGTRLRKGELRVLAVIEAWLAAEGRSNPNNPLDRLRLIAHCLACDAPLTPEARAVTGSGAFAAAQTRRLPTGETLVECGSCPAINVIELLAGDPAAVQLHTKPLRPRPE